MSEIPFDSENLFQTLQENGIEINDAQKTTIENKINNVLTYEPKIGVFGKTGVGKSSLCNALFGEDVCKISNVEACTRDAKSVLLSMPSGKGIKLIDVPGVGESCRRDEEYAELYSELLPELDVVLWLLKADDRAYASDENFYKNIVKPHIEQGKPFFFVLNQVDKLEPTQDWNLETHEPGVRQYSTMTKKIEAVSDFFQIPSSRIIAISSNEKYGLTALINEIIYALPNSKKITVYKQVNDEFKTEATGEHVKNSFTETVGNIITNVVGTAIAWVADKVLSVVGGLIGGFIGLFL